VRALISNATKDLIHEKRYKLGLANPTLVLGLPSTCGNQRAITSELSR
jgi:hypothetical protein